MAPQRDSAHRNDIRPDESAAPHSEPGRQIYGQSITRVDFFRRMPTGSSTAYVKPGDTQN